MRAQYFLIGLLCGVIASVVLAAATVVVLATRSLPELPDAGPGSAGDISVSIQEGYLGAVATELVREQEPMIQRIFVDVKPDARVDVIVGLQISILGRALDLSVQLVNSVRVEDARLRFDVQKIEFAGLDIPPDMLPESLRRTLQTTLADVSDRANRMLEENGLVPLSVATDDLSVTVSLSLK